MSCTFSITPSLHKQTAYKSLITNICIACSHICACVHTEPHIEGLNTRTIYLNIISINAIRLHKDLLTSVKRRKLKWNGHVTRPSGLAKTILQGTVQGGRRRGRQRKRWEDNIKEWTGLEWNIILQKAKNREEWRKLVVKSTVVPQWSAGLRDRYEEEYEVHCFCCVM